MSKTIPENGICFRIHVHLMESPGLIRLESNKLRKKDSVAGQCLGVQRSGRFKPKTKARSRPSLPVPSIQVFWF